MPDRPMSILMRGAPGSGPAPAEESGVCQGHRGRHHDKGDAMAQHVLIVDDEPNIVLSLEFLLARAGFTVATASDGDGALASAREQPPDVVLLDIMLPGMDGYELCQAFRELPGLERVPILMLTARGREVDREKGLSLGADDYIVKPFSTREVVERVQRLANGGG